jgi:Bacterial CdiA-CT RNAse A domain
LNPPSYVGCGEQSEPHQSRNTNDAVRASPHPTVLTISTSLYAQVVDWYGRDLLKHEKIGGHTIKEHVSQSLTQMKNRCRLTPPAEGYVSTFSSLTSAEKLVASEISIEKQNIISFIRTQPTGGTLIIRSATPSSKVTGSSLKCGSATALPTNRTRIVIKKDTNNKLAKPSGWFILTSFPFN